MASPWPLTFSSGERPRALWALLLITLVIQYCNCTETNTFRSYCSKVTVKSFILWAQNFVVWCWWTYSWTLEFVDFQIKHTTINLNQQLIGILNLRIVLPSKYLKLNVQQIKMNSQYSHWSESPCMWLAGGQSARCGGGGNHHGPVRLFRQVLCSRRVHAWPHHRCVVPRALWWVQGF